VENRWTKWLLIVGGWALLGLVLSIELYFNERAGQTWVEFADVAIPQFGRALMWALLAPLILQLRVKVPLRSGGWVGGVGFHLLWSFVLMAVYYLGRRWAYLWLFHLPTTNFMGEALRDYYGHNLVDMAYYWAVLAVGHGLEIHRKYKNEELKAAQLEVRLVETELKARSEPVDARLVRLIDYLRHVGPAAEISLESRAHDRILVKSSGEVFFLKPEEIDWIEAEGDYIRFHVAGQKHLMRETMVRLAERLDPQRFVRVHRSAIVNIDRVRKLTPVARGEYAIILQDGTRLRLGRGFRDALALLKVPAA
jgi:hypothetical protein